MITDVKGGRYLLFSAYISSVFLCLGSFNLFQIWIALEVNTVIFLLLIFNSMDFKLDTSNPSSILYYFMIQGFSSMMLLLAFCLSTSDILNYSMLWLFLVSSLVFKMGLIPFHFWAVRLSFNLKSSILSLLVTLQKIVPICILLSMEFEVLLFMSINLIYGCILMFASKNSVLTVLYSTMYSLIWLYFMFFLGYSYFFSFYLIYSIFVFILFVSLKEFSCMEIPEEKILILLSLVFVLGLPPMPFFFFKILSLEILSSYFSISFFLVLWVCVFLTILCYINFFYNKLFIWEKSIYFSLAMKKSFFFLFSVFWLFFMFVTY